MPARRASRRRPAASAASSSRVAARVASVVTRMPPAAYGAPAMRAANSSPRSPANTRRVWLSTKPGITQRPPASRGAAPAAAARSPGPAGARDGDDLAVLAHERSVADQPQRPLTERRVAGDQKPDPV